MWTVKKATTSLNFLKRYLRGFSTGVKDKCYRPIVRPILEYSSHVWDPHTQRNVNKLEITQRRATHFVKGDYEWTSSVTSLLSGLEVIKLSKKGGCKSMQPCSTGLCTTWLPSLPCPSLYQYLQRTQREVFHSTVKSHLYSFFSSTISIWNQLPECTVSAKRPRRR